MGEIAEDMLDGTSCSWCGQYFQDPKDPDMLFTHGFPVICKECFDEYVKEDGGSEDKLHEMGLSVATVDLI